MSGLRHRTPLCSSLLSLLCNFDDAETPLKEKQRCFLTEACECKRSFEAKDFTATNKHSASSPPLPCGDLAANVWLTSLGFCVDWGSFAGWLNTRLMDRSGLRVGWVCLVSRAPDHTLFYQSFILYRLHLTKKKEKRCTRRSLILMLCSLACIIRFCWDCNSEKDSVDFCHFSVWWPWLAGCSRKHWFLFCQIAGLSLLFACLN